MPPSPRPQPRPSRGIRHGAAAARRRRRRLRRRGLAIGLIALAGVLGLIAVLIPPRFGSTTPIRDVPVLAATGSTVGADAATPAAPATPATRPEQASPPPPPPLRLAGQVPPVGSGSFIIGAGQGEVVGRAGRLLRYRVAVEKGAGEDVTAFVEAVDGALSNPGSWTAGGQLRLHRVPDGVAPDFTVYLATPETARAMCAAGGVDIRVNGRPYTSCRAPGKVIINLERWRQSVDHFVADEVPLATYRDYVINHEVGHELGKGHERCPGRGRPAPVMMQQTLFLDGCVANPWPYLNGRRYAGPGL